MATDLRLHCRHAIDRLDSGLHEVQRAFLEFAQREPGLVIPGYTHLRRAQPVLAAHQLLAWCEKFQRDRQRLADCRSRTNILPLGSGALAGTSLPIDREHVRHALDFESVAANSLDAASDRDFVCELAFVLSASNVHVYGRRVELSMTNGAIKAGVNFVDHTVHFNIVFPSSRNLTGADYILRKNSLRSGCRRCCCRWSC